jgi:hypothetical protein
MVNTPEAPQPDAALERQSKALFDASVAELDARTRSRLCQARHAAVAQAPGRSRRVRWVPALASAAAVVMIAVMLPRFTQQPQPMQDSWAVADDITLLMNDESLELLEEIEFYAWLDDAPGAFPAPAEPGNEES